MAAQRSPAVRMAWMLVTALVCVGLVTAIDLVFVHTTRGQWVDDASLAGSTIGRGRVAHPVSTILNVVSVTALGVATIAVGIVGVLRKRPVLALLAMLLVTGSVVTTEMFKHVILSRPILDSADRLPFNTLPSGHTTVALSVGVAITLVSPARLRAVVAVLGAVYGGATGVATMSAGWHRPSDAVAACLVVAAWSALVGTIAVGLGSSRDLPDAPRSTVQTVVVSFLAVAASVLLAIGTVALVVTAFTIPQPSTRPRLFLAYAGGASAVAGAALLAMTVLLVVTTVARTDELDGPAAG